MKKRRKHRTTTRLARFSVAPPPARVDEATVLSYLERRYSYITEIASLQWDYTFSQCSADHCKVLKRRPPEDLSSYVQLGGPDVLNTDSLIKKIFKLTIEYELFKMEHPGILSSIQAQAIEARFDAEIILDLKASLRKDVSNEKSDVAYTPEHFVAHLYDIEGFADFLEKQFSSKRKTQLERLSIHF